MDQIRSMVDEKALQRIVFATATPSRPAADPLAAAVALHHPQSDGQGGDMATVVHAGIIDSAAAEHTDSIVTELSTLLDHALVKRGVRFVQWATDARDAADDPVSRWCRGFRFQPIATLDYLSAPVTQAIEKTSEFDKQRLRFERVELGRSGEFERFAALVERTYAGTLDCPKLAEYRTASQTLGGYQAAGAFDPKLWLHVYDEQNIPVGCMVLACHQPRPSPQDDAPGSVIEIVYMGLVPEARGRGAGQTLVRRAIDEATSLGADRIILGVDQKNRFARAIYQQAGLEPMLSETVWVKSLELADS